MQGLHDPCNIHTNTYTHTRTLLVTGRSSFLIGYPPLPGGQHVVERVPADACSVERGQEGTDCWSTVSKCSYQRYILCLNYSTVCRIVLLTWARCIFITSQICCYREKKNSITQDQFVMFRAFQDYLLGWGPVISQCINLTLICLVSVSQLPKICHVLCLHCILGGSIKKPICIDSEWSTPKPDIYSDLLHLWNLFFKLHLLRYNQLNISSFMSSTEKKNKAPITKCT